MILAESYTQLVTDPAHIFFELTWEAITAYVGWKVAKPLVRRFKRRFHAELDAAHGIEHAIDGKPHDINKVIEQRDEAIKIANVNAQAYLQQKETADDLRNTLQGLLRKNVE